VGTVFLTVYIIKPTYISSVKLYVVPKSETDKVINSDINDLNYAQKVVNTYIEILRTNVFFNKVAEEADLGFSENDLKNMISFRVLNDTEIFQIDVSSVNPAYAKIIADIVSVQAPAQISGIIDNNNIKLVQDAEMPLKPSSPNLTLNLMIGFVSGLVISMMIAIIKEILDFRVKSSEDIINTYKLPILGSIPNF
jgi:capsular polysaccharide biosynthesis protein